MNRSILATAVAILASAGVVRADALAECTGFALEVPVDSTVASASLPSNLLRVSGSIRGASERMLERAEAEVIEAEPPDDLCPTHCALPARPSVIFRSTPSRYLEEYDDADRCERQLEHTRRAPLLYPDRTFATVDDLTDWLRRLSTGRGEDGEDLYTRCDGDCSPRYTWIIDRSGDERVVDAEIVCGPARDRHDNRYELSSSLRWVCREP